MSRYSDSELEYFRSIIEQKLVIAKKQLAVTKEAMASDNNDLSFNRLEEVDSANSYNLMIFPKQVEKVEQLQAALKRIESKTYGICIRSGKLIDKRRLELIPETTFSIIKSN